MVTDQMEKSIRRIPFETVILGLVFGLITGLAVDPVSGVLVLGGALLSGAGFLGLRKAVDRWLGQPRSKFISRALALYLLRLGLICLFFLTIIFLFKKKVIAFVAGFSLILISVMVEALINLLSTRKWKV